MPRHTSKHRNQRPQPKLAVIWNRNSMSCWLLRLGDNVAGHLVDFHITPLSAKHLIQVPSRNIPRNFHATETTSSLTRCSRILSGPTLSK